MTISLIVAMAQNRSIGKDNDLPWKLPTDLKRFKEITSGHTVVMGRKCWESIPAKFRPLPNRENIVVTRNSALVVDGAKIKTDLVDYLTIDRAESNEEMFIIGGAEIYKEAFPFVQKLYLTRVLADVEGDVFLEGLVEEDWLLESFEGPFNENGFDFRFETYVRNNNGKTDS